MDGKPYQSKMHSVCAVARHRPFKVVMLGPDGSVTLTVQGVSLDTVIEQVQSRRLAVPAGMLSFSVTDEESGDRRVIG